MQIGPSCYQPAPARSISVSGLWYPYQNDLIVATQQEVYSSGSQPDEPVRSEYGDTSTGRRLFTMPPLDASHWMEVDLRPQGTIFNNEGQFGPPTAQNVSTGVKWTPARARITWTEQGGVENFVDVDIGAGTNFVVPPTNQVWVDLLVPNPDTLESVPVPPTIPPEILRNIEYITTVSCKVTCVKSPGANRACLTRLIYLGTDALRLDGNSSALFPTRNQAIVAPRGTKAVALTVGQSGGGGPGGDAIPSTGDLLYRWEALAALGRFPSPTFNSDGLPDLALDIFPSARFEARGTSAPGLVWQVTSLYPGALYSNLRVQLRNGEKRFIVTAKFTLDL
jgi:hypothetical protein